MARSKKEKKLQLSHTMTHYLLVIHNLKETRGYARITDIAKELKITKSSVSTGVNSLKRKGLVQEEFKSKFLVLSEKGHHEVHCILSNRSLLFSLFKDFLKVKSEDARSGSCFMEHLINQGIREKIFYFLQTISLPNENERKKKLILKIKEFKSDLKLTKYKSLSSFIESQSSDFY